MVKTEKHVADTKKKEIMQFGFVQFAGTTMACLVNAAFPIDGIVHASHHAGRADLERLRGQSHHCCASGFLRS